MYDEGKIIILSLLFCNCKLHIDEIKNNHSRSYMEVYIQLCYIEGTGSGKHGIPHEFRLPK